jgi:hypothetical protein
MNIYVLIDDKQKKSGARTYHEKDEVLFKAENEKGWGVYFAVNTFEKDRKTEQVTSLRYVYADMDIGKKGDGQTREQKQEKKARLHDELMKYCEPTFIIDTSNGLQPLWQLSDTTVTEESKKRYVRILKGIVEWSKTKGSAGDNVYDISRIVRLPGYYHQKEEPYMCEFVHKKEKKYTYEELEEKFPYAEKEYIPQTVQRNDLSVVDQAIDDIDFQDLMIRAWGSTGRTASFDKQGRVILDGRLTGTFQGKKDGRQYLASTSHESFKGNKITAVADILTVSNKEARKWIMDEYNINYTKLVVNKRVETQLKKITEKPKPKEDANEKRFTWGTRQLDINMAIIKTTNFIVVGAKRSSGKTTYSFDMACKNARLGHKTLYISLEMDTDDILDDFGRKYSGITIEEEFDKKTPKHKLLAYNRKKEELRNTPNLFLKGIRRSGDIDWETIQAVIDSYEEVDMVFVDNLDLISGRERETDVERQKRIVKSIMGFTSEKRVPLVLIHHYRKSSQGKDHGMDELSGSGKIADGADRIIKISRNPDPLCEYPEKNRSTISLQKGRGYPEHTAQVYFIKGTFVDDPPEYEDSGQSEITKITTLDEIEF